VCCDCEIERRNIRQNPFDPRGVLGCSRTMVLRAVEEAAYIGSQSETLSHSGAEKVIHSGQRDI
jgi:hypothetical protein